MPGHTAIQELADCGRYGTGLGASAGGSAIYATKATPTEAGWTTGASIIFHNTTTSSLLVTQVTCAHNSQPASTALVDVWSVAAGAALSGPQSFIGGAQAIRLTSGYTLNYANVKTFTLSTTSSYLIVPAGGVVAYGTSGTYDGTGAGLLLTVEMVPIV
ncbi:hypothetical protein [Nitrospira sp. BLG_1]|uniref:hypothetical protein n=1 Tax=Nitrospira sp. BLG_1 TaxID=3395883 RepID=UPI0039BCD6C3